MARPVITEPCLLPDVDEDWYHADCVQGGSLSVSGAKLLLQAPAKYDYARRHGSKHTKSMDTGTRVHALVLGKGFDQLELLDFPDYKTKAAQEEKKRVIAAGRIPTLTHEYREAQDIADAVLKHPTTGGLLAEIDAEVSMFWRDEEFGIWCRARADALTYFGGGPEMLGVPTMVDVKKTKDASPEGFAKSVFEYGYHRQDPWYREGWAYHLGCDWQDIDFVFAVVEEEPPHLVATYRIAPEHVDLGLEQNRIARERFRDCVKADRWPGYSEEIEDLELPRYGVQRIEKDINDWYR